MTAGHIVVDSSGTLWVDNCDCATTTPWGLGLQ
jgi:hypothetical protein